jgi:hypothetical protein
MSIFILVHDCNLVNHINNIQKYACKHDTYNDSFYLHVSLRISTYHETGKVHNLFLCPLESMRYEA